MPSASFNASSTTSVLRCSLSRLASGADSWLSTSVPPSTARTTAPASITASERLRSRTLSSTVDHCLRIAAASGSPATAAAGASTTGSAGGCTGGGDGGGGSAGSGSGLRRGSGAGFAGAGAVPPARRGGLGLAGELLRRLGRLCGRAAASVPRVGGNRHVEARLDALHPLQQSRLRIAGRRQQQSRAHHFEQQPRRGGPTHLAETRVHHLGPARQRPRADAGGLIAHPLQHVAGCVDHAARGGVGHRLQHDQVAEALEQIGGEPARVVARVDDRLDRTEQRRGISGGQRIDGVVDQRDVGGARAAPAPVG